MEFMHSPEENQPEWRFSLAKILLDGNIRMKNDDAILDFTDSGSRCFCL
jgi:hypothetical protein